MTGSPCGAACCSRTSPSPRLSVSGTIVLTTALANAARQPAAAFVATVPEVPTVLAAAAVAPAPAQAVARTPAAKPTTASNGS